MKAIIFGAPGSGKGTYSSRLQSKLCVDVISTGDIFREMLKEGNILGRIVKRYVEAGLLVPDIIVTEVVKDRLGRFPAGRGFILDGYPRTLEQAEELEKIANIDVILKLDVPDWIIVERLSSRRICKNCGTVYNIRFLKTKVEDVCDKCGGPLYLRPDDNPAVIKMRLVIYEKQTSPLVRFYKGKHVPFVVHHADSLETPPEQIVDQFVSELQKLNLA